MNTIPEYPHSPVHHLNNPTIISTIGKMTHCEVCFLAGQRKATKGKAGFCLVLFESSRATSEFVAGGEATFFFRFGLFENDEDPAIPEDSPLQ